MEFADFLDCWAVGIYQCMMLVIEELVYFYIRVALQLSAIRVGESSVLELVCGVPENWGMSSLSF